MKRSARAPENPKPILSDSVCDALRAAISDADGNEIFALGRRDNVEKAYDEVRIVARGHVAAVPAVTGMAEYGDLALHNHPSGNLHPSEADLGIAARLADEGIGFAIVDNDVSRIYVVVEPFSEKAVVPLSETTITDLLKPNGPIQRHLEDYEPRPGQLEMAKDVTRAFNEDGIALVEAGTGTGKSLAYLVPAALWAARNRERVLIASGTINLQEQLVSKDLPLLKKALKDTVEVALVKGRRNYIGLRRLGLALQASKGMLPLDDQRVLQDLAAWAEQTEEGSLQDLPFTPPPRVWDEVSSDGDACLRLRCPEYQRCFFFKSRRRASRAGLLIANHHLFFADTSIRMATGNWRGSALLPAYRRVILDEAHKAEDAAAGFFGGQITRKGTLVALSRLYRRQSGGRERGLLPTLAEHLAKGDAAAAGAIRNNLIPDLADEKKRCEQAFEAIDSWLVRAGFDQPVGQQRVTEALCARVPWREVADACEHLGTTLQQRVGDLQGLAARLARQLEERQDSLLEGLRIEVLGASRRLATAAEGLVEFSGFDESGATQDGLVRWFEWSRNPQRSSKALRLRSAPLDVGPALRQAVWEPLPSHAITSATLTTGRNDGKAFDYIVQRLGLDSIAAERVQRQRYSSPFDYRNQALVALPEDLPEPSSSGYPEACAKATLEAVRITQGRAFVLFTSYSLLKRVYQQVASTLESEGLVPLRQGDGTRTLLLERFRDTPGSVLFGTDSFWEGVDVRGQALESVIITRLPFRVPTEPLIEARAEAVENRGGNPFREISIPDAVIRFKQGFGRLIRHRNDRGSLLVLDRRVATRGYGKIFTNALPEGVPIIKGPWKDVTQRLREFHQNPEN